MAKKKITVLAEELLSGFLQEEGLEFSRNRLERTRTYEPFYRPYNLFLDGCRKVRVAGNSFGPDFPGHNIGIVHMRPSEIVQRGGRPLEIICK